MEWREYLEIRHLMKPGDVIAFGGDGAVSSVVKAATGSPVSHVATVLSVEATAGVPLVMIAESTSLGDDFAGVRFTRLSDMVRDYVGDMWWLPLNYTSRVYMDQKAFVEFVVDQEGKVYDTKQAIGSALDHFDILFENEEDLSKLFCSEYVTAALQAGFEAVGKIDPLEGLNPSEQTPADVVAFPIYYDIYQFKGEAKEV